MSVASNATTSQSGAVPGAGPAPAEMKSREVRFGLVMYGGVSLAIYINGVSHEFFRAVRGAGPYRLLKALTDSELVVDVMSGSSAGGINGIFLSYALANDKDFGGMAELWRQRGDIDRLLRQTNEPLEQYQSLLDSEGYYEPELQKALLGLQTIQRGDYDPAANEIDLFVTGTNVDGEVYTVVDDDGHSIDVKDHRTVFWLKHRVPRKKPFDASDSQTAPALARLARLTSCFPAAYAPVNIESGPKGTGTAADGAEARLRRWGDFENERYFLDGGVLNNKPFSHTIQAIFHRTQVRPVDRFLVYVEPDPDYFPGQPVKRPSFVSATIGGAFGIKGYESIADDLKLINQHNSEVDRYWYVCHQLRGKLPGAHADVVIALHRGEGRGGIVLPPSHQFSEAQRAMHGRSRFSALGLRCLQGMLTKEGKRDQIPPNLHERVSELIRELYKIGPGSGPNILSDDESFFRFDVYFRLRRLYHTTYWIAEKVRKDPSLNWSEIWKRLNLQIEITEIIRFAMEYVMDRAKVDWSAPNREPIDVWNSIRWYLELLLTTLPPPVNNVPRLPDLPVIPEDVSGLAAFYTGLMKRAEMVCTLEGPTAAWPLMGPQSSDFQGLLAWADEIARQQLERFNADDGLRREFVEYVMLDAMVFPVEQVSGLESKDRIRLLRISPRDAQSGFSRRDIADKLAGDAFAHFGGFFKRSWRSNDILWGRLDTVGELHHALLSEERLTEIANSEVLRNKVADRLPHLDALQKLSGSRSRQALLDVDGWLRLLLSTNPDDRRAALDPARREAAVERLIEIAQLEILESCLPTVIADAVTQQTEWNQYAGPEAIGRTLSKRRRRKVLALARNVPLAGDRRHQAVQQCQLFASETGQDRQEVEDLWKEVEERDRESLEWWDANGRDIVTEAIDASFRASTRNGRQLYRFRPTQAFVDATVAARAAEHFASASIADLKDDTDLKPRDTKLGRFFLTEYAVGSEDIWDGIPWLILLQILAKAGLVLRSCLLGALPKDRRDRVIAHPLFRFGLDWPLKFVYRVAEFERQRPGRFAAIAATLVGASLVSLAAAGISKGDLFLVNNTPVLWRIVAFAIVPIGVLYGATCRILGVTGTRLLFGAGIVIAVLVGGAHAVLLALKHLGGGGTLGLAVVAALVFLVGVTVGRKATT